MRARTFRRRFRFGQRDCDGKGYRILLHVRASHAAFLRKSAYCIHPGRQGGGLKQAGADSGGLCKRLQIQEQMTAQIADAIMEHLSPRGVMVVIEAEHMCMTMRGVKKPGSLTETMAVRGEFKENTELQKQFL